MPNWIVRLNCEYSIEIEADDADGAMDKSNKISLEDWNQAYSGIEAEEEIS